MKRSIVLLVSILVLLVLACGGSSEALATPRPAGEEKMTPTPFPTIKSRPTTSPTSTPKPTDKPKPNPTDTKMWFSGGTLHNATVAQWVAATEHNRRASAADWVTAIKGWDNLDELEFLTGELVFCTSETVAPSDIYDLMKDTKINEIAAACAALMGWGE